MHVAFGRVRRKSRIIADDTDDADFKTSSYKIIAYLSGLKASATLVISYQLSVIGCR